MTHSDFDLDPRSQQGALAASAAPDSGTAAGEVLAHGETANENRKVTFQDTPALWPLPAVVSWRLARDPSAVNALCKPLSAQPIKKSANLLKRYQLLWTLASRALGIDAEKSDKAIDAAVRKARADHAAGKLTAKAAWYRAHQKARECLEQQRPEDEKIATTIVVECRRLLEDLIAEKMTAQGNCSETGWCERIPPASAGSTQIGLLGVFRPL